MGRQFSQLPVVFLSYDEPYADGHFKRLQDRIPAAKRVHGVKGFDACHKAAAVEAGEPDFITVDADNIVLEEFWHIYLDSCPLHLADHVLSWRSFNLANGLQYGNGGLKLWRKDFVEKMVTHEVAEAKGETTVDFCWDTRYTQLRPVYSVADCTTSPYHAWRAGYREGAKMPLKEGVPPPSPAQLLSYAYNSCIDRLTQWASVGRDKNYGAWSMVGTIEGLLEVHVTKVTPLAAISDYRFFDVRWKEHTYFNLNDPIPMDPFTVSHMRTEIDRMLTTIREVVGLHIPILGPIQAKSVKQWLWPLKSTNPYEEDSWHQIHW